MKKGFLFFFLLLSNIFYGQMITTPATQSIEASTTVNVNDFVVNWGNNTESLLISLSLEYQSTATFNLPTTTGLTRNYGYSSWTGVNTLAFYGTRDNVNAALAAMTITMGSVKTAVKINVEVSPYDASYVYNPVNKHYYKYVASSQITYLNAKAGASSNTFLGKTGYLVTITSQSEQDFVNNNIAGSNIWIALSDAATATDGTWMLDAGPEAGTIIKTQNGPTAGNISGQYNNWCTGEPNGANHSEDYAVAKWDGGTCWNDLSNTNTGSVAGYIVEVSADFPSGSTYFTGVYTAYIVHNNDIAYSLGTGTGLGSTTISNYPNVFGGLQMNDSHTLTVPTGSTFNSNKITLNGTGKVVFTDASSKWMPGTTNVNNTFIHSPTTNSNPSYWSVSSSWTNDAFSSSAITHYTPYLNATLGWAVASNDANQWIILNYDIPTYIAGIVTQGRGSNGNQLVRTANVDVSTDGTNWTRVLTDVIINTNTTDAVTTYFPNVVYAKFVKIIPTDYVGHMTMRLGLIIKSNMIVPDGLALHLDAGNLTSYMGTGTSWNDLSGNGMIGTLGNSPTFNLLDFKGYFTFNGSTTQVSIPDNANLEPGSGDWTMEAWIYSTNITANTVILGKLNDGGSASSVSYMIRSSSGGVYAQMGDGTGTYINSTSYVIAANKWYHVAFVWKAGGTKTLETFINGKSVGSVTHTMSSLLNSSNPLYLGRYNGGEYPQNFTGNIGIVRLYKKALSLTEIGINFNANRGRYGL